MDGQTRITNLQANALFVAWLTALASTLGALFVGEVMGQAPCILCWYQRIAMFPLALILGIASFAVDPGVRRYVLPIAFVGGVIALWHSLLYVGIISEAVQPCTRGGSSCVGSDQTLFGILPLPFLSLGAFSAIVFLLSVPFRKASS